jgi:hypothetical protein
MFLIDQPVSGLPSTNIAPSSLSLVIKVLGFVVSWATSIYFLWVRKSPKDLSELPFFEQTQRISIIITSIFLMLTWGALGNSHSLRALIALAIALTGLGIVIYFVIVAWITRKEKAKAVVTASPLAMLVCFLIYTAAISCGLTAAGVFIVVLLTNPANAALGTNLTKPEPLTVTLTVAGKIATVENQGTPFRVTSGQQNFGCEETRTFVVEFTAPTGAVIVGQSAATLQNADNAKILGAPTVHQSEQTASASGQLRGLDYQNFPFGIRNCPGGGHGELVLSGEYRSSVSHEQPVERVLTNDLDTANSEPVWVSLPDFEIETIKAVCKLKTGTGREWTVTVSPTQTNSSDGPFQVAYVPQKKQLGISYK